MIVPAKKAEDDMPVCQAVVQSQPRSQSVVLRKGTSKGNVTCYIAKILMAPPRCKNWYPIVLTTRSWDTGVSSALINLGALENLTQNQARRCWSKRQQSRCRQWCSSRIVQQCHRWINLVKENCKTIMLAKL